MTARTYTLDRIVDVLAVPSSKRKRCLKELLYALELMDLTEVAAAGPLTWTDDGDVSCTIFGEDGKPFLTLEIGK